MPRPTVGRDVLGVLVGDFAAAAFGPHALEG